MSRRQNPLSSNQGTPAQILILRIDQRNLPTPLAVLAVLTADNSRLSMTRVKVSRMVLKIKRERRVVVVHDWNRRERAAQHESFRVLGSVNLRDFLLELVASLGPRG